MTKSKYFGNIPGLYDMEVLVTESGLYIPTERLAEILLVILRVSLSHVQIFF